MGFNGLTGVWREEAGAHLGAPEIVDDRTTAVAHHLEVQRHGASFHGSPVEPRMRKAREVVGPHRLVAVGHEGAHEGGA